MVEWYRTCKEISFSTLLYPLPKKCSKYCTATTLSTIYGYAFYVIVELLQNSVTCLSLRASATVVYTTPISQSLEFRLSK